MLTGRRGESFPEGFTVGEQVLFTVKQAIVYGQPEGQPPKFHINFYLGIIRKIVQSTTASDITSVEICNVAAINVNDGNINPVFFNQVITENDLMITVSHVLDNPFTESSLEI